MSQLLFAVPPIGLDDPQQCESLASWCTRLALSNGFRGHRGLFRQGGIRGTEPAQLDHGSHLDDLCTALSELTQEPVNHLLSMGIDRELVGLGVQIGESVSPWLLRAEIAGPCERGSRHVVCVSCLGEDKVPYWRRHWRLSTSVRCPVHRRRLIDHCTRCLYPITIHAARETDLLCCTGCGDRYDDSEGHSYRLARAPWMEASPLSLQPDHLPTPIGHPVSWWRGVRGLLLLLSRPGLAKRLTSAQVPSTHKPVLRSVATGERRPLHRMGIHERHGLIRFVGWLLEDWPTNFLKVMASGRVTAWEFDSLEFELPYWVQSEVESHLARSRYRPGASEVRAALAVVERRHRSSSKIAVKRLLGISEGRALDQTIPHHPKHLSADQVRKVVQLLDQDIAACDEARDARASLIRDACCIGAAMWQGKSFAEVCAQRGNTLAALPNAWQQVMDEVSNQAPPYSTAIERFQAWMSAYTRDVRPRFERLSVRTDAFFLSRYGQPYGGFGLAARFAELLRRADVSAWQRGARLLAGNGLATAVGKDGRCL